MCLQHDIIVNNFKDENAGLKIAIAVMTLINTKISSAISDVKNESFGFLCYALNGKGAHIDLWIIIKVSGTPKFHGTTQDNKASSY